MNKWFWIVVLSKNWKWLDLKKCRQINGCQKIQLLWTIHTRFKKACLFSHNKYWCFSNILSKNQRVTYDWGYYFCVHVCVVWRRCKLLFISYKFALKSLKYQIEFVSSAAGALPLQYPVQLGQSECLLEVSNFDIDVDRHSPFSEKGMNEWSARG